MSKIYKVSCEYYIKANSLEEVNDYVREEDDFYERHIILDEMPNESMEHFIDVDLTR